MRDQYLRIPAESIKCLERFLFAGCVLHHIVGDAGQFGDFRRNRHTGIDKSIETFSDLTVFQPYRTDFGDAVILGVESGGFQVKHDEFIVIKGCGSIPLDRANAVVDVIRLHAIDDLDVHALFSRGRRGVHRLRERLRHTVVGDGDGLMPP